MKKVLVWGATDTVGGVEAVLWNYVSHISSKKVQFDFINTYADISIGDKVRERGGKVFSLTSRKENYIKYRREIEKFMALHAEEYDAVWLNDCMFGNIDILKLAKKYGIKQRIIHAHNSLNMGGGKSRLIRHKINSYLLRYYVTDYWACSLLAGNWSYPKAVKDTIKVIPNAVDVKKYAPCADIRNEYRNTFGIAENTIVYGHVGRFHFQKNHIFLVELFAEIHKKNDRTILWLIGNGEDEDIVRNRVEELGIEDAVQFLGIRKDVANLLQAIDAFLLPSLFEGLPVVLVEAQAAGLPCYVADTVTEESDISGNLKFFSLESPKAEIAQMIQDDFNKFNRRDISEIIRKNGYAIFVAARKSRKIF